MKGRRNLMNGLGEVGCVYVCMYALHVLNFCGFRAVSEWFQTPSGGLADLDERNNLQTEKT